MSEKTITPRSTAWTVMLWIIRIVIVGIIIFFFSAVLRTIVLLELPIHFLLGWLFHAKQALPPLLDKWQALLLPVGCLILAGTLAHRFIRRSLEEKGSSRIWRPADTASCIALILLGCGAAIALSGVAHQAVWLMGDRWIRSNHRSEQTMAINNARQLMIALAESHIEHDRYPNSLQELESTVDIPEHLIWVQVDDSGLKEPFILLVPGQERIANPHEPVIISPIIRSTGKFVVGYGDFSVTSRPAIQFDQILQQREHNKMPTSTADE